ncbi:hypothetical protein L218DRAFT_963436, partial [Marasmius fiardii PR-910]
MSRLKEEVVIMGRPCMRWRPNPDFLYIHTSTCDRYCISSVWNLETRSYGIRMGCCMGRTTYTFLSGHDKGFCLSRIGTITTPRYCPFQKGLVI